MRCLLLVALIIVACPVAAQGPPADTLQPFVTRIGPLHLGSWFSGEPVRNPARVLVVGPQSGAACEAHVVEFTLRTGGWSRNPRLPAERVTPVWSEAADGYRCIAELYWQLGDAAGTHHLRARLVRPPGQRHAEAPDSTYQPVDFRAEAHVWPALVVGIGWLDGPVPGPASADSTELDERRDRVRPMVGVDFPLPFAANLARSAGGTGVAEVLDRLRLLVGTSAGDAGDDLYLAMSLFALYGGARGGGLPVQLYAGRRYGLDEGDNWFLGATVNAPAALAWAVRGLGFL